MFVRCPECGFVIGYFYDVINEIKQKIFEKEIFDNPKYKNYSYDKIQLTAITPNLQEVFDLLNIKNRCCRMHLISYVDYSKRYN